MSQIPWVFWQADLQKENRRLSRDGMEGWLPGGGGIEVKQLKFLEWDFLVGGYLVPGLLWLKGPDVDSAGNWGSGGLCHRAPACVHVVTQNAWGQALFPGTNLTLGLRASLLACSGLGVAGLLCQAGDHGLRPWHLTVGKVPPPNPLPFPHLRSTLYPALTHHPHTLPGLPIPLC